ncbi:MAG: aldo/keto reductase [Gemmatimonadetes bacterium]|nr:aldo/keto reductase [Gemmatimonadota bacterium]
MGSVERVELAPGLQVSRVVTGLWQIADMERGGEPVALDRAASDLGAYAEDGLTTFDMADHYGSAEEVAGEHLSRGGAPEFLTKWVPKPGPADRDAAVEAVERACGRLRMEQIPLLQFHAWNYADPSWLDHLAYLDDLRREGKIAHLGMTNCDAVHFEMALDTGIPLRTNQVCYSLIDRRPAGAMASLCAQRDVRILAYGTLAGGFLSDRWLGAPEPALDEALTWSQMKYKRFIDQAGGWGRFQELLSAVRRVADRFDVPLANVASRYVMDQPGVAAVIIGARPGGRSHRKETLGLFSFALDEEALGTLSEAASRLDPIPGGCGDEYRRPPFLTASGDLSHHLDTMPDPYPVREVGGRHHVFTGTVWEELAGFSRAVRLGSRIVVSGTTATHGDRVVGGTSPTSQTHFVIDKIEGALTSLGSGLSDVVRTRVYIRREEDWEAVSRAHGARFDGVWPANTLVVAEPIGDEYLVEVEAEAQVEEGPS